MFTHIHEHIWPQSLRFIQKDDRGHLQDRSRHKTVSLPTHHFKSKLKSFDSLAKYFVVTHTLNTIVKYKQDYK